ncbi:MAG: polyketide synthase, partial [bacterium]|nr:polyketide synthase [bacterium]
PDYVKTAIVLDDVEWFDAQLFGFHPREAEILDPQQRIFLECAWEALEHAGYDPDSYPGAIGLFAGVGMSHYLVNLFSNPEIARTLGDVQLMLANDKDFLPTRVSYKLNLRGPSVAVQTACSTSLVATHLASQSLLRGECEIALVGGVTVFVPQGRGYLYQEGGILSPDGHCRAFDARARGTIPGSG